jgi:hypothetical protein
MTWEIFNEPEGMTTTFGNCWTPVCTQMIYVQQFINLLSGAIHREVPTALVSNGSWNMRASSDVGNFFNYYSDDRLIAAGGDEDGILDFVQVHFYPQWESNDSSPFHHPASYWGIDKPIIIGEFPAEGLLIGSVNPYYNTENSYDQAYKNGYAGAMSWSWTDVNFGGFAAAREGISFLISTYSNGLVAYDTTWVGPEPPVITGIDFDKKGELNIYPNPANNLANIQFQESSFNYQLINQLGNTIQSGFSQSKETQIDLSGLQKGMYFINVYNSNMSMIRRLIKE